MSERLKAMFKNKIIIVCWLVLLLVLLLLGIKTLLPARAQPTPSIEDVLSQSSGGKGFNFSVVIASLLAFSLATLSAAKGYELFKKKEAVEQALLGEVEVDSNQAEQVEDLEEKIARLRTSLDELCKIKDYLQSENRSLKEQLNKLAFESGEIARAEQILRKGNISLSKECERLKSENELLLLRVNSLAIKERTRPKIAKRGKTKK